MSSGNFDYVIIGGGTAGLVLAARLIEDPTITVCVLEAGEEVTKELDCVVPGFGFKNIGQPKIDWGFVTSPQMNANGRSLYLPRGKALGGSSMINLMCLGRGHEAEYNAFETLGSPGWSWKGLFEYFRASERFTSNPEEMSTLQVKFNSTTHGTSGPLQRTLPKWICDVQAPFIQGMESLGIPFNSDSNSGNNVGMWSSSHAIDSQGARVSSTSAYYEPNKSNLNLTVITGAQATRILFSPSRDVSGNLVASGVEYHKGGQLDKVSANEVLLCAGTFQTPQLLELSGIGDKTLLEALGIDVNVDLPGVGTNLQDHFWCPFVLETDPKYESLEILNNPVRAAKEWKVYEESKTGMLSVSAPTFYSFLPRHYFVEDGYNIPEQMHSSLVGPLERIQKQWFAAEDVPFLEFVPFPGFLPIPGHKAEEGKNYCSFFLGLTHPFSSGTVHIISSDPLASPAIDPCVLNNKVDVEILLRAIKFARQLATTQSLNTVLTREVLPGTAVETDDEIRDFIRTTVNTAHHPLGTAAMLPREDGGVVDPSLKVYGTFNIRVIDASIIPIHLSAHIQATVYAIAEKASDIIKRDRRVY
ncbi:alcohol oxidase [Mycena maculata]|uniref:Alcohol oxidase n=1 Tax=Mycena maculata TaxID=230809 RepID=A0AAD7NJK8_9AGAR|nr:alcohol oxidase [Mycena maculata]